MEIFDFLKEFYETLFRGSISSIKCLSLKLAVFGILILLGTVTVTTGEELTRLHLGSDLRFNPSYGENMGFLELQWGGANENIYAALSLGLASKTLLSSAQLKDPDVVKVLDNLVQSDTEFFIGGVLDQVLFHFKEADPGKYELAATTAPGLPNIPPGTSGLGARIEWILNFPNKKTENDPSICNVGGIYLNTIHGTKHLIVCPMVGIGFNEGLDYHFFAEERNQTRKSPFYFLRWKIRLDISTRKIIKIGEMNFHFFLVAQHEWSGPPFKTTAFLQLEDGRRIQAKLLRESSVRLGIWIDLFASS